MHMLRFKVVVFVGAGVHAFASEEAEVINEIIALASQGKTASCRKSIKRSKFNPARVYLSN